jgi:hypothetical protein
VVLGFALVGSSVFLFVSIVLVMWLLFVFFVLDLILRQANKIEFKEHGATTQQ